MIVEPDFLDHWKTRLLVNLLGDDECAPVYLLRLWGHCQNRKKSQFENLPPAAIKAICRYSGDAEVLDAALQTSGYLVRIDDKCCELHGWVEHNRSLVANWENGKKGGRPKATRGDNP